MTIKLLPSKKVAPVWLPYIASGVYILAAAFTVYFYIHRMWLLMAICLPSVFLVCQIISPLFSWYVSATLSETNKCILYTVRNLIRVLGHMESRYHICSVSSIKMGRRYVDVYGDIEVFEPMMKGKPVKKVRIEDITYEGVELLEKWRNK